MSRSCKSHLVTRNENSFENRHNKGWKVEQWKEFEEASKE